jgi:hypothetical protein
MPGNIQWNVMRLAANLRYQPSAEKSINLAGIFD